jgi:outer membrane protein assembly factor BamE (lipoprotein component of BamABCDE complex)
MAETRLTRTVHAARGALWRRGAVLALALLAAACSPLVRNHGYVPEETDLALIEIGTDTRETVAQKIGRPSTLGLLNDEGWYYVQSRYEHFGPREPREVERQVLAVTFDASGTVENIARFGLKDGQVVEISRRVTQTNIKGIGLIRQLLGNIGRVDAGNIFGN